MDLQPFTVAVPEADIADLRARLAHARWPDALTAGSWDYGVDADVLRQVCEHWRNRFDWRAHEAWLNAHPQVIAEVDGSPVHALHARSAHTGALPLVLLHGWPSTVSEFRRVVEPLRDPVGHGGRAGDAFDVVLVSLPGFGFSGPTRSVGWDADRMADAIASLLRAMGIDRFGVFGTDAGAYVATSLAARHAEQVVGLHLHVGGVTLARQARLDPELATHPTDAERRGFAGLADYETRDGAYAFVNGTRPHTVAYALADSPVGQAAWILEKFHTWTEPLHTRDGADGAVDRSAHTAEAPFGAVSIDDALAIVTTYWFTGTAASSARFYRDAAATMQRDGGPPRVEVPTGCAAFPGDIVCPSRRWAERTYPNIVHWTDMPRGGHFSALEVPDLLVDDLRAFFGPLR